MARERLISIRLSEPERLLLDDLSRKLDEQDALNASDYRLRNTRSAAVRYAMIEAARALDLTLPWERRRGPAPPVEASADGDGAAA